jgi:hypothetical protein
MTPFGAVRPVEPWTAASVTAGVVLLVVVVGLIVWRVRRFLRS